MQQHQRAAIGVIGRVEAMDKRQLTIDDARFSRQRELRQDDPDVIGAVSVRGRYEELRSQSLQRLVDGEARPIGR
jgi:hypothetical protein